MIKSIYVGSLCLLLSGCVYVPVTTSTHTVNPKVSRRTIIVDNTPVGPKNLKVITTYQIPLESKLVMAYNLGRTDGQKYCQELIRKLESRIEVLERRKQVIVIEE